MTHEGPADLGAGAWVDDVRWVLGPEDGPTTLASWLDLRAAHHRRIGGDRHAWLAGQIAKLADQARFLDAPTPEAFDARLGTHLDRVRAEAEAHLAARGR